MSTDSGQKRANPRPPASLTTEGKRMWAYLVGDLIEPTPGELTVLRVACEAWSLCQQARHELTIGGLTTLTRDGGLKSHPAAVILKDQTAIVLRCLGALGIDSLPLDT